MRAGTLYPPPPPLPGVSRSESRTKFRISLSPGSPNSPSLLLPEGAVQPTVPLSHLKATHPNTCNTSTPFGDTAGAREVGMHVFGVPSGTGVSGVSACVSSWQCGRT